MLQEAMALWFELSNPGNFPGKLKKTILEDREYRAPGSVLPLAENAQPRPVGLVAAPAVVEPFMPSWCMEEEDWLVVSDYFFFGII